jgi:foldase protein PrsA
VFRVVSVGLLVSVSVIAPLPALAQEPSTGPGVVARVGEEPIAKRDFDRWLRTAARGNYGRRAVLDPPRFERCLAAELRRLSDRERRPSRAALRLRCRRRYETTRDEVMQYLVQAVWIRQEAAARGIEVTPPQVRRAFERQTRGAFENERAYRRFLRRTGTTEADLMDRLELDILQRRIVHAVQVSAPAVTGEDVDRYYAEHRRRYRGVPRRTAKREIRLQLTASRRLRAIGAFARDFRRRYRAITVCAEAYAVPVCGRVEPAPAPGVTTLDHRSRRPTMGPG